MNEPILAGKDMWANTEEYILPNSLNFRGTASTLFRVNRRSFVKTATVSALGAGLPSLWLKPAVAAPADIYEKLDRRRFQALADLAMSAAKKAGTSYADIRICRYQQEDVNTREERVESITDSKDFGFGVRVLLNG